MQDRGSSAMLSKRLGPRNVASKPLPFKASKMPTLPTSLRWLRARCLRTTYLLN